MRFYSGLINNLIAVTGTQLSIWDVEYIGVGAISALRSVKQDRQDKKLYLTVLLGAANLGLPIVSPHGSKTCFGSLLDGGSEVVVFCERLKKEEVVYQDALTS